MLGAMNYGIAFLLAALPAIAQDASLGWRQAHAVKFDSAQSKPASAEAVKSPIEALKDRIALERAAQPLFLVTSSNHEGREQRYLVVREGQLGRPFLLSATIERGVGYNFVNSTLIDDSFLVSLLRSGDDKVRLVRRQTELRAGAGTPELAAIERTTSEDVLAVALIKASSTAEGYLVVAAEDLFVKDLVGIGLRLQYEQDDVEFAFDPGSSFLSGVKSFPKNLDLQVQLAFEVRRPKEFKGLPVATASVLMRYSLAELPDDPAYEVRAADPRVGYFKTTFRDLSRPDLKDRYRPLVHHLQRWKLEKKEPASPVSEVKEPIVFWLEDSIPEGYRDAVRAGILAWNAAFEAVGLKGALAVKQVPAAGQGNADMSAEVRAAFDPADISYNLVRWYVDGFSGAIGPSRTHPLTGQIFHAVISVSDGLGRDWLPPDWVAEKGEAAEGVSAKPDEAALRRRAAREAALGAALLEARGATPPAELKRYQRELLTDILAHEVGHTLGLEHNFKASQLLPQERLGEGGLVTASVMDYNAANIAPPGALQGPYYQTVVGPYDRWAIEYGYAPVGGDPAAQAAQLGRVAAKADSDPALAWGSGEDVDSDVDAQRFDLGRGAVPFARARVELAQSLWKTMASAPAKPGEDNARLWQRFSAGIGAYYNATEAVLPLIGGQRTRRGSGRQFEAVPAAEQRQALRFIEESLLAAEPFQVSPELLDRLGNDRLENQWNGPFPIAEVVQDIQAGAVSTLLSRGTLRKLDDRQYRSDPGGRLTPSELLDSLRRSIWSEASRKKPAAIHGYRRRLQQAHLARLIQLVDDPRVSSEARGAARRDLERIARDATEGAKSQKDDGSRLHLAEVGRAAADAVEKDRRRSRPAV